MLGRRMSTKNSVLFLDDDPIRLDRFKSLMPYAVQVSTADEAMEALTEDSYDVIFLDHDLGGEIFVDSDVHNTGATVALWLSDNLTYIQHKSLIVIHSFNPVGVDYMYNLLKDSYKTIKAPFGSIPFLNIVKELNQYRQNNSPITF
jgi:hypothetical protein